MPPTSPRTQRKRPGDLTGVRGQHLAAQAEKEKDEARERTAKALQEEKEARLVTEVDYTEETRESERKRAGTLQPAAEAVIEARPRTQRIRVNYPIEQMTFGREVHVQPEYNEDGTMKTPPVLGGLRQFNFEEGRWYHVDSDVAEHLRFLGYVYE